MNRRIISLATTLTLLAAGSLPAQHPMRELTVDATSDADFALVDLDAGTVLPAGTPDSATPWQLGVQRYALRLNHGITAALLVDNTLLVAGNPLFMLSAEAQQRFDSVTEADIPPPERFGSRLPSSVAVEDSPPFVYGVDPSNPHAVSPTFNIYLVKDGDAVYKVQFLSYYHPVTGAARMITIRFARLR
ncbi:MAG TPA: HmuY family protein [Gemmatimonadales bacterium]|nr:HmuY family protein [Gemmatimonadales bacterium]